MELNVTYENAAKDMTLERATRLHENNIAVIVNDGRDVTLAIEKEPTTDQVK